MKKTKSSVEIARFEKWREQFLSEGVRKMKRRQKIVPWDVLRLDTGETFMCTPAKRRS